MIELKHISKTFPTADGVFQALDDINLTIRDGDIFGIVGMSGAGKSTLVRCINLLERPTAGQVVIDGQDLMELSAPQLREKRRSISMIFQQFNLLMQRTCLKNVCFPMEISGVRKTDAAKRAMELLELVGLPDKANAYPAQLSGGQKQRVAIAGVMAMEPKCIVLDEPTAMLDPNGRKEVIRTAHELNRKKGVTIILITHYMEEVVDADKVIVMDQGKVVMQGTPREVFSQVGKLKEYRLDVPQVTILADLLRQSGIDVPVGVLHRQELVDAILRVAQIGE